MNHNTRQETLTVIEATLEGVASDADVARLEQLVLTDMECLNLYLEMTQLHGNLYWDAAGRGAEFSKGDVRPVKVMQPGWSTKVIGLLSAVALIVVAVISIRVWNGTPLQPAVAEHENQLLPSESIASVAPISEQGIVGGVRLPHDELKATDAVIQQADSRPEPKSESALQFDPTSDVQVVSFINDLLQQKWREHQISASPVANDSEWVRRIHLDLAGRIPTTLEVENFLKDQSPEKRTRLVDSLLQSRDFANHFASLWTNLLVGHSRDQEVDRERLFAYLERQFGNNDPWSSTVTELIAAEGPGNLSGAANFLLAHLNNEAVPATSITARIFLCQQLQCSQCHRHPTAVEWGQEKFWELNAFFQRTSIREEMLVDQESGESERVRTLVDSKSSQREPAYYEDLQGVMKVAYPKYAGVEVQPQLENSLRAQLAQLLTTDDEAQLAQAFINRSWKHLFGYAFTRQVDDMGPHHTGSHPELLQGISEAFVASNYDVQRLLRWICLSDAYQLSSSRIASNEQDAPEAGDLPLFSRMYVKPLSPEQLYHSLLIAAGVSPEELYRRRNSFAQREDWLQQFFTAVDDEENGELSTFDGSLPQTLMMMNGDLVQRAVDPIQGRVFKHIIEDRNKSEIDRIQEISLAVLSRYPSKQEIESIRKMLRAQVRQQTSRNIAPQFAYHEALRDVYWAYLNSSEFSIIR